jgi:hypothetical protein
MGNKVKIIFEIGNRWLPLRYAEYDKMSGNFKENLWTAYVRLKSAPRGLKIERMIKHCNFFYLKHQTDQSFHRSKITPKTADFIYNLKGEISFTHRSWFCYEVPIEVHFKKELKIKPISINHRLAFENGGNVNQYSVCIQEEKLKQFCIPSM